MSDFKPTAHINAQKEDIAQTVLMPGDPHRSRFIAENFLTSPRLVNDVRGVQGYTGSYRGMPVTVMASGMGVPSMGIYSHELFSVFGTENIIRVGTAGALRSDVDLLDVVLAMTACTNSSFAEQFKLRGTFAPAASYKLLRTAHDKAGELGLNVKIGPVFTADTFYDEYKEDTLAWGKLGVLAVEMETAALYTNAARFGKNALTICTVSDNLLTGGECSVEQRQSGFTDMMRLALETAAAL